MIGCWRMYISRIRHKTNGQLSGWSGEQQQLQRVLSHPTLAISVRQRRFQGSGNKAKISSGSAHLHLKVVVEERRPSARYSGKGPSEFTLGMIMQLPSKRGSRLWLGWLKAKLVHYSPTKVQRVAFHKAGNESFPSQTSSPKRMSTWTP
jgi:hypothetical protein